MQKRWLLLRILGKAREILPEDVWHVSPGRVLFHAAEEAESSSGLSCSSPPPLPYVSFGGMGGRALGDLGGTAENRRGGE